jgi:membrane associated rhomboid family serine protease
MVDRRDGWIQTSTADPQPVQHRQAPARPRPELPRLKVIPVLIVLNVGVFILWQLARSNDGLMQLMWRSFVVSPDHLAHGLLWTLLTSVFSHEAFWHIGINMLVLYSFGRLLERLLGPMTFLAFYLGAGLVGSLSHCLVAHLLMHRDNIGALGASGAICGLLMAFSLLFPKEKILVFFVLPVPALVGTLAFAAFDLWGIIAETTGNGMAFGNIRIGHGAHLGGMIAGALFYALYARPRARQLMARLAAPRLRLEPAEAAELDRLHRKITEQGRDQLTPDEQRFLAELRQRLEHDRASSQ